MSKLIILSVFLSLTAIFVFFFQKKQETPKVHINQWISENKGQFVAGQTILNKDNKVIKFETDNARISLAPNSEVVFKQLELKAGEMRIQSLWKNKNVNIKVADLSIDLSFGDYYLKKISQSQVLFFTINGLARFNYNHFNYDIKENNFFIYEINKDSMNLVRLFSTDLDINEAKMLLKQTSFEFYILNFNEKLMDLEISEIKSQSIQN